MPRSPQGRPVIIQAGQSGRGKRFGAQWGELIFVVYPNITVGKRDYAGFKAEVAGCGRNPEEVKITHLVSTVAAASRMEAEDKWALINKLPLEIDALSLLSEALNFDFSTKGMDDAFTDEEMAAISGLQAIRDRVVRASGNKNPTVREFMHHSGRGRVHDPIIGGPKEVCDALEQWFTEQACDGFMVQAPLAQQECGPHPRARAASRSPAQRMAKAIVSRNATRRRGRIAENRTACHSFGQ